MENIYEDFGKVISSERYILREIENDVQNRIFGKNFGSYSLVGLPRVGKTSMIYHIFTKDTNDIVIKITLSFIPQNNIKLLFDKIINNIKKNLKKNNLLNENIEESLFVYKECDFEIEGIEYFLQFIEIVVSETEKKIIIIIDEFDATINLFKNNIHYFQIIREMAIQPNYNTAFIFLSRRLVEDIEIKMDGVSNLRQVLKVGFLKFYNNQEQKEYFEKLSIYFDINDDILKAYKDFTGFYPYLMDVLSVYLVDKYNNKNIDYNDVKEVYNKYINEFYSQYEKLKILLVEENLFDELLQIAFNLPFDIKHITIQKLKNYGLINEENKIFCISFENYLLEQRGLSDYHKIWNKTEKLLKHLTITIFEDKYGIKWENKIKSKYKENNKINKIIKDATFYKSIESQNFNQPSNTTFIDTISTSGLLSIILEEWIYFNDVFSKSKKYWIEIFNPIRNIRNIIQHNREEIAEDLEIKKVILNCEEIIVLIEKYFNKTYLTKPRDCAKTNSYTTNSNQKYSNFIDSCR